MELIAAKCTNCGANLKIDKDKDAGICSYCNTAFITEKAINNYNTYVTNNHITNITKNIYGREIKESDEYLKSGEGFLKLDERDKAEEMFNKALECDPLDYRAWLGLVKAASFYMNYKYFSFYILDSFKDKYELVVSKCNQCLIKLAKMASSEQVEKIKDETGIIIKNGIYQCWVKNNQLVHYNSQIKKVIVPAGVNSIKDKVFYSNTNITSIVFPESLKKIYSDAFYGCTNLTTVILPDSLEHIDSYAFANCSFSSIVLPKNLKEIGNGAFSGCNHLDSIKLPDTLIKIGSFAFRRCINFKEIIIPDSVAYIGERAFDETRIKAKVLNKQNKKNWHKDWDKKKY